MAAVRRGFTNLIEEYQIEMHNFIERIDRHQDFLAADGPARKDALEKIKNTDLTVLMRDFVAEEPMTTEGAVSKVLDETLCYLLDKCYSLMIQELHGQREPASRREYLIQEAEGVNLLCDMLPIVWEYEDLISSGHANGTPLGRYVSELEQVGQNEITHILMTQFAYLVDLVVIAHLFLWRHIVALQAQHQPFSRPWHLLDESRKALAIQSSKQMMEKAWAILQQKPQTQPVPITELAPCLRILYDTNLLSDERNRSVLDELMNRASADHRPLQAIEEALPRPRPMRFRRIVIDGRAAPSSGLFNGVGIRLPFSIEEGCAQAPLDVAGPRTGSRDK
jgi:hypothetical protein